MTSPSWPVRISLPLPGTRAASTNRMSPPVGVQASPVATPGTRRAHRHLALEAAGAEYGVQLIDADPHALGVALGDAHGDVMQNRAELALEIAHAGLPRVVADDGADRVLARSRPARG